MEYIPRPYLDPGSGSFILQVILAALLGIGLAVRASWARIKRFFGAGRESKGDDAADDDAG